MSEHSKPQGVNLELSSLYNNSGATPATPRPLQSELDRAQKLDRLYNGRGDKNPKPGPHPSEAAEQERLERRYNNSPKAKPPHVDPIAARQEAMLKRLYNNSQGIESDQDTPAGPAHDAVSNIVPEGVQFDKATLEDFSAAARDAGLRLTPAQTAKLIEWDARRSSAAMASRLEADDAAVRADPELGKDIDGTVAAVNKALAAHDPSGNLRDKLEAAGLGNDPDLLRLLSRVGRSMRTK